MDKLTRDNTFKKCGGRCAYCGEELVNGQTDHKLTKMRGGTDDPENLLPICRSCNASKATYTVEEFRQRLIEDVARLRRDSTKFRILERYGLIEANKKSVVFTLKRWVI